MGMILWANISFSQINKACLQASGLTCALCAKSIYSNLTSLGFIDSVDTDLETSSFLIVFKPGAKLDIDAIRNKVEDAGFHPGVLKWVRLAPRCGPGFWSIVVRAGAGKRMGAGIVGI